MGIRSKLLFPLISLGAAFAALLHLYWLPEFRTSETIKLQDRELATLEVVAAALTPPLLSGDLAQIHATLEQLKQRQSGWNAIQLKADDGRYLYPIAALPASQQDDNDEWLTYPVDFEGKQIASLELSIDIDAMLASQLVQIKALERLLLIVMFAITLLAALFQDRWIRRPLKTLVTATSRIADGDFNLTLPSVSTHDEVGKLITSFDTMRVNLAQREKKLSEQHALLNTIRTAQSRFIRDTDAKELFGKLLADIINLTDSEYGFIGEILYRDGNPYLRTFAISDIAWNEETRQIYDEHAQQGMEFTNMQTLFGAAICSGEPTIANNPRSDSRAGGMPDGHPPLNAFLGLPFLRDGKVIGMFGIANRPNGYDQQVVNFLEPITSTCTHIVEALKADRSRIQAEMLVQERETRMSTIFENVADGIITTNEKGVIESFNRAAEHLFGYSATEVVGKNISMLTPMPHRKQHDKYIKAYLGGQESKIFGTGREVEGVRKDGSLFPIDIAVNDMRVGEERMFCSIMRDITERKKIDRMKNEFVSTVSHELRTPLTSIRGSLGLLAGGAAGELPPQALSLLDIAGNNTERLLLLINDILDIEKIESGQMAFKFSNVPVKAFLEQSVKANQDYARQHHINLKLSNVNNDLKIHGDPDRLMQVMNNLLSNAVKFSPEDETVEIAVICFEGLVRISVTDHGSGIPKEFQPKLFEKFTQSDASDTRQIGGTGLGLNITRAIVEKHGGNIDFTSQQDIGTTFYFELPVLQGSSGGKKREELVPSSDRFGARILIVEDDPDVASVLRMMLIQHGFNTDIALDARQAKELMDKHVYTAVTMDIMLPDQDGISLIRELREQEQTKMLPIIVISAKADVSQRELSGGAVSIVDWLNKPIDQNRLLSAVNQLAVSSSSPVILHVEDEPDVHVIVSTLLKGTARVVWARTLTDAKEQLANHSFDLALLDIGLPDGSAIQLLDKLNQHRPPIPTVMFSAQDVDESISQQVSAALVKSSTSNEDLIGVIRSLLPAKHAEAENELTVTDSMEADTYEQ
jgi:PAS domain S-box-containing protein